MPTLVYSYNVKSKGVPNEFIGPSQAQDNPRNAANPLKPANSTFIQNLPAVVDQTQCFSLATEKWVYYPDNRGKVVFDETTGKSSTIDYIGPILSGFTTVAPPDEVQYYKFESTSSTWILDDSKVSSLIPIIVNMYKTKLENEIQVINYTPKTSDSNAVGDTLYANMDNAGLIFLGNIAQQIVKEPTTTLTWLMFGTELGAKKFTESTEASEETPTLVTLTGDEIQNFYQTCITEGLSLQAACNTNINALYGMTIAQLMVVYQSLIAA